MLNFAVDASADRCVVLALDDEGGRRAREAQMCIRDRMYSILNRLFMFE